MNLISYMKQLIDYYYDNDYENFLAGLEQYFSMNNVGINDKILAMYIESLIKLGLFDKAISNIELMLKIYPDFYDKFNLAIKYSYCREIDKLNELISEVSFSDIELYYLGKCCFYNGLYEETKILFNKYILVGKDRYKIKEAKKILWKIEMYQKNEKIFAEVSYIYFKGKGEKLSPGHIVYVERIRDEDTSNQIIDDVKKDNRPYMIWKIDGEKIYAFPVTSQINKSYKYVLQKRNYPTSDFDRIVKGHLVSIHERDITKVIDKVRDKDYHNVLSNIYQSICSSDDESIKTSQIFIDEMLKEFNIQINDVILMYDFELKKKRFYFVIEIDSKKQRYKTIEVGFDDKHKFKVIDYKIIMIDMKAPILNVVKLDEIQQNNLLSQVPVNYKKVNIQINDVILMNDLELKKKRFYFVIEIDSKKQRYKTIEVRFDDKYKFKVIDYKIIMIDMKAPLLNVVKLDEEQKNNLLNQVPVNYKKVNMLGKVVCYDSKELEIMLDEGEYYLCIDRTKSYSSSNISIYFLRKDIPLFNILSFSNDVYQKHLSVLEEYLKNNYYQVRQRKKEFLVRLKSKK